MANRKSTAFGWLTVLLAAVALSVAACGKGVNPERPPEPGDVAVARVNGHTVWASEVKQEAVFQQLIGEGEPLDMQSDLFRQVMEDMINRKLLVEEALKRKLDKDPQVQRRLAAARDKMLADTLLSEVVNKAITETAIRGLYQEQQKLTKQVDELHLRQIVTPTEAEAEQVKKLLQAGASFDALSVQRSIDTATRFSGGDMGFISTDVMPPAYASMKDAKAGDLVGPLKVDGGFAVVKVDERRPEPPITLEAARPQIIRFLSYDQVRSLLADLRGKAKIEILLPKAPEVPGAPREPASAPAGAGAQNAAGLAGGAPAPAPAPAEEPVPPGALNPTPHSGIPPKSPAPAASGGLRK